MRWLFATRRERLRRQAADWVALLNGPHSEADRAEFERWYASSAEHAAAFDRLSGLFATAGRARRPDDAQPAAARRGPTRPLRYALAAAAVGAALLAFFILSARTTSPLPDARQQFAAIAADREASRRVRLADGSEVLLSPGSTLDVALGAGERRLRLTRGEARFSVAHEARPFIVAADGTEVIARGTQFLIRIGEGRTTVALIEGRVDVAYSTAPDPAGQRRVAQLRTGEQLVVQTLISPATAPAASAPGPVAAPTREARGAAAAMLQFDDTPLSEALEQANRHGSPRIRLADPALARLRLTGAFRRGDTRGFADSVAAAFALQVEQSSEGTLSLRHRAEGENQ